MDLIREINKNHGLGGDEIRSHDDPVVVSLRGILERACETLSLDLYNTKTHFLLEFIQNADDNEYETNVVPKLQLRLHGRQLVIRCNEKGFRAENVRAICDVRRSTKTKQPGSEKYIGEKGIGFKAVFAVAERVHVASREFAFRFDREGRLGMINPIWDPSHSIDAGWTTFRLDISPSLNISDLSKELEKTNPTLLLFLRRLRAMDIEVTKGGSAAETVRITISRIDEPGNIVRLECHENGRCISTSRYLVFKQMVPTYPEEAKRRGIRESEIVLAFPVSADGEPEIGDQFVHAFLPVAKYGLPFLIQADFLTPSSREGIISDSTWNLMLFDGICDVFMHAVEEFQQDPVLWSTWVRFIPIHAQPPFANIAEKIVATLRTREVLYSSDGCLRRPRDVFTIPKSLRVNRTEPLIPPQHLPGIHYLLDLYDVSRDRTYLTKLGVKPLSEQHVLDGLAHMDCADAISAQGDQWHETACAYLHAVPQIKGKVNKDILKLRLLPLNDGSWRAAREAAQFVFVSDKDITHDIEFRCITDDVKEYTARHNFFLALGVRRMGPALIATTILLQSNQSASLCTLIRYARFFYEHRNKDGIPHPSTNFKVMDQTGRVTTGDEVYMELPEAIASEVTLRDVLPSEAKFLHRDYVALYAEDRYWLSWLQDNLGVHTSPRIISGRPSPEIYSMAGHLDSAQFLDVLRAFWPQISASISPVGLSDLSGIEVICDDDIAHPLRTTALKRQNLSWLPPTLSSCLNFIPVTNPDDTSWGFLASIGVTLEANATAWVGMLFRLQEMNSTDEKTILGVYQQLNARFVEVSESILTAFLQHPLVFVPPDGRKRLTSSWVSLADVYWDGPSTLRSKFIMKSVYADLEEFFVWKLGVQNAPIEVLVGELIVFTAAHAGSPVTEETVQVIEQMLVNISIYIAWKPASQFCLLSLVERAVFPVYVKEEVRLQRYDQFYISEKGGKSNDKFRNSVPILAFSSAQTLIHLRSMFESNVWPHPPRMLEAALIAKSIPLGPKILDQEATDLYSNRSEYMEKYIQHITRYNPTPQQTEFLAKMRNTSIYVVDTIIIMWSLGGKSVKVQSDVKVSVDDAEEHLTFYVSKACAAMPRTRDREICSLLGDRDRVAIDKLALQQFVTMPWDDLLLYLEDEGVDLSTCIPQTTQKSAYEPEVSAVVGVQVDKSALQSSPPALLQASVELSHVLPPEQKQPVGNGGSLNSTLRPDAPAFQLPPRSLPRVHAEQLIEDGTRCVHNLATPLNSAGNCRRRSSTLDHSRMPLLGTTSPAVPILVPPASSPQGASREGVFDVVDPRSSRSDDRDPANGVLGELYVFRMLQQTLGTDFTEMNWTSELRGQVPGFSPYNGPSVADFCYADLKGILTNLWCGKELKQAWKLKGRWPTYHLEVKTTSGVANEPFHMSAAQLNTARRFNRAARVDQPPQDIYVIIRVSEVKSMQPKHHVYIDPHKGMYDGELAITCEVDVVPQV